MIGHGGDRSYYKPAEDRIQLPPQGQFRSSEVYYATTQILGNHRPAETEVVGEKCGSL